MKSIDDYILQFPDDVQVKLQQIRALIKETAPLATEKISYQMPTFFYKRNLVHFAAYEKHIGFYPGPEGIATFQAQLQSYKHAKGSVQFPLDQPIPFELIRAITTFRYTQELAR